MLTHPAVVTLTRLGVAWFCWVNPSSSAPERRVAVWREPFPGCRGQTNHGHGTLYLPHIDCDALKAAEQGPTN
jgi:hypothetical protein